MQKMNGIFSMATIIWLLSATMVSAGDEGIIGTWKTADGSALIDIYHCGVKICGRIAWLRDPFFAADDPEGMAGQPCTDRHNPSPELRDRRVVGLQIMEGFTRDGENRWSRGTIYDADTGRTYKSRMTLISPNRLELHGYIGIPLFGRSSVWTRQN
jgi:uncharacterized protein (DUF2147 family)